MDISLNKISESINMKCIRIKTPGNKVNFLICLFIREAKRSMSGVKKCLQILTKMSCFNIHSLESANFLESKSA